MLKYTGITSIVCAVVLASSIVSGCAAKRADARAKLPVAETVCLQVEGIKEPEKGLLLRRAKAFLAEREFRSVESDCDVKIGYTALDQGRWEMMGSSLFGLRSTSAYRAEGIVTVWGRDGKVLAQDLPINLRDYSSKADMLEALAWEFIEYVPENFRSR